VGRQWGGARNRRKKLYSSVRRHEDRRVDCKYQEVATGGSASRKGGKTGRRNENKKANTGGMAEKEDDPRIDHD